MMSEFDLKACVSDATKSVEFKLVRSRDDIENDSTTFHPDMAHQIFGPNENIFGYKDLKIRLFYTAGSLNIYFGIKYSFKVSEETNQVTPDDVSTKITEILPMGCYYTNLDEFLIAAEKSDSFKPFGEKSIEFDIEISENVTRTFEIYMCDIHTPKFLPYHARFQSFILWFIDAASYIDQDDPQWLFFVCYEKYTNSDGKTCYASVGYSSVYQYYAYPEHIRPRISQMLILPPFQKMGIGTKLIETIYNYFLPNPKVIDLTVEDASDDFQKIRNYIDAKLCKSLPSFSPENLKKGFNKEMVDEARQKLKINPLQCRRVYEILRLFYTNIHNSQEYQEYRLDVKKRLNMIYYKQKTSIEKLEKRGIDVVNAKIMLPPLNERLEQLHDEYTYLETDYKKVIKRLQDS